MSPLISSQRRALTSSIPTPPDQEWQFNAQHAPPDYQLYAWMEYEYARSSRYLREQVKAVRMWQVAPRQEGEYADPSPGCRFACLLARHAPEFPDQAWNTLALARRSQLLVDLEMDRWDTLGRERVLKELDLELIGDQYARGEPFMDLSRSSLDRYVAFRINLGWSQPQILNAFAAWLRRACDAAQDQSRLKVGHLAKRTKGRGLNRRLVLAWMNRLAALRLGRAFLEDWEECQSRIRSKKIRKVGYGSKSKWDLAQYDAANLLQRFEFSWQKNWTGTAHEILEPRRFTHTPGCRPLVCRLPWSESPSGKRAADQRARATAALREFIRVHVQ